MWRKKEIKGTSCDDSDEKDQFSSALAWRRKTFPWSVVCTEKLPGLSQSTEASSHTAGMLNKTTPLLIVPLVLSPCPYLLALLEKKSSYVRTWHSLGMQFSHLVGRECNPIQGSGCDKVLCKTLQFGVHTEMVSNTPYMTPYMTNVQMLPCLDCQLPQGAQQRGLCSYRKCI